MLLLQNPPNSGYSNGISAMMIKKLSKFAAGTLWLGCSTYVIRTNYYDIIFLEGPSMEPTLHPGEVVILKRISGSEVSKGEVVCFKPPHAPDSLVAKRITGMPGDIKPYHYGYTEVPKGHMWVEGDNPPKSKDSSSYGAVPQALVVGRLLYRIWPLKDVGHIN